MPKDDKNKNNDEPPVIFKFYGLFAFLGVVTFGVCMGVGLARVGNWLVFVGLGLCLADFVTLIVTRTVWETKQFNKEQMERAERERERAAQAAESPVSEVNKDDSESERHEISLSAAERVAEMLERQGVHVKDRTRYRKPKGDGKWKAVLLLTMMGLLMAVMMVGCGLASVSYVGFILMGIGGGGFFLTIILLIVISKISERAGSKKTSSTDEMIPLSAGRTMYKGTVTRCEMYSQNVTGEHKLNESTTKFKLWVEADRGGKRVKLTFISPHRYRTGDTVYFVGDIRKPKKCKLIA